MDFKTSQEKRQTVMIIILTVVLIATALVYYFGFYKAPVSPVEFDEFESEDAESVINRIEFDIDFFKEPRFQSLQRYGQWPIEEELETGRSNPFLSFETKIPEEESTTTEGIGE